VDRECSAHAGEEECIQGRRKWEDNIKVYVWTALIRLRIGTS
jgi:hypothetical protein